MLVKLRADANKKWFNHLVRDVFNTPPVNIMEGSNTYILTQLHPPDLRMYLLAVKSFARFFKPAKYIIVDDGLSGRDRKILSDHLESPEFIPISSVELGACPKGGCWERLASIAALNADAYIIQLDADTLTLRRPDEVIDAVVTNSSFTLGTLLGREIISALGAAEFARDRNGNHIQMRAEALLSEYPGCDDLRYVRGCAGFAGFPPGTIDMDSLSKFSTKYFELLGESSWQEWGSEQFASNFFVANSESPKILPFEEYPYINNEANLEVSKLIHFVGSHRFHGGVYSHLGREVIRQLK